MRLKNYCHTQRERAGAGYWGNFANFAGSNQMTNDESRKMNDDSRVMRDDSRITNDDTEMTNE